MLPPIYGDGPASLNFRQKICPLESKIDLYEVSEKSHPLEICIPCLPTIESFSLKKSTCFVHNQCFSLPFK